MRSLAAPLALASAVVALSGCSNGEYCVSPHGGSELCGAAARAWCDDSSPARSALEANPHLGAARLERLQSVDDACANVGGL
jgi:hypothetical protein